MKLHFSSQSIEKLNDLPLKERQIRLSDAQKKLTVPEKLILNIIKLVILTPPFLFLARKDWLLLLVTIALSLTAYLVIMKPINFHFINKHLR